MNYVADFETTTQINEFDFDASKTRVWGFGVVPINNYKKITLGTSVQEFMAFCEKDIKKANKTIYFHNLRFDGNFIISYLLNNGYRYSEEKEEKTFSAIISNMREFYQIEIIYKKTGKNLHKVTFYDSFKKFPMSVDKIASTFNLQYKKLKLDYHAVREEDHQLTDEERLYIRNDLLVVAEALKLSFEQGLTGMTIGADALRHYKKTLGKNDFKYNFPIVPLEVDRYMRQFYRGGFTYLIEKFKEKELEKGIVLDVNSIYPAVMVNCWLPYGLPQLFEGQYEPNEDYPLYIQELLVEFKLKKGHLPTIQIKGLAHNPLEYVIESGVNPMALHLTNVDLVLFFEHYDILYIHEWRGGFMFKQCKGAFDDYINYWTEIKIQAKKDKNYGLYVISKLMLNNLYGKFGKNPDVTGKYPRLKNGIVKYIDKAKEFKDPVYLPMAIFITSYARDLTIRAAQANYDRFVYADTDSLHLVGDQLPAGLDVHSSDLGKWSVEGRFIKARFIKPKTYVEVFIHSKKIKRCTLRGVKANITCAGMKKSIQKTLHYHEFVKGNVIPKGKLRPVTVQGGTILVDSDFTIK